MASREEQGVPTRGISCVSTAESSDWSDSEADVRDCGRLSTPLGDASVEGTVSL